MASSGIPSSTSSGESGQQFEQQVALAYRALGYDVERNVILSGQQVDILAQRRVAGTGTILLAVECKYRGSSLSLPNHEVADFATSYGPLVLSGTVTKAVLVSNVPASAQGKAVLRPHKNMTTVTLDALRGQVLDPTEALSSYVDRYEATTIYETFIEPSLRVTTPTGDHRAGTRQAIPAVRDLVDEARTKPYRLVVLADFGAGKTTLLERIKYEFAKAYLKHERTLIPVFFRLQDFGRFPSLDEYAAWVIQREFGHTVSLDVFWGLLSRGNLLVLLDSFDEIAARVDQHHRLRLLLTLSPLLTGSSPAIMTSRPSYFVSLKEFHSALKALRDEHPAYALRQGDATEFADLTETVMRRHITHPQSRHFSAPVFVTCWLEPLSEQEIDLFLSRYDAQFLETVTADSAQVGAYLRGIYDLSDLMKRPIILEMVVDTVLSGAIDIRRDTHIGPSQLYEAYTSAKLGIDWDRGPVRRGGLGVDDRRRFAEACAVEMSRSGTQLLGADQVGEILDRLSDGYEGISREEALTDLRTCSFLTIDERGLLRFIHKSFGEFFMARQLFAALKRAPADQLVAAPPEELERFQPVEVLQFAADFVSADDRFRATLLRSIPRFSAGDRDPVVSRNLLVLVLLLHRQIGPLSLRDQKIYDGSFRHIAVSGSTWRNVDLERVTFESIAFTRSQLVSLRLRNSSISELVLDDVPSTLSLTKCDVTAARITRSRSIMYGEDLTIRTLDCVASETAIVHQADLGPTSVAGGVMLLQGRVSATDVTIDRAACQLDSVEEAQIDERSRVYNVESDRGQGAGGVVGSLTATGSVIHLRRVARCTMASLDWSIVVLADPVSVQALLSQATISSSLVISCAGTGGSIPGSARVADSFFFGIAIDEDQDVSFPGVFIRRRRARASRVEKRQPESAASFRPASAGAGTLIVDAATSLHEEVLRTAVAMSDSIIAGDYAVPTLLNDLLTSYFADPSIARRVGRGLPEGLPSPTQMTKLASLREEAMVTVKRRPTSHPSVPFE